MDNNDELYHFGIPGMKWGRRKGSTPSSGSKTLKKKKTDPVKSMTNEDLKKKVARLNLEKQYKDLNKKQVSAGRKFVQEVLTNSAKTTATTLVSGAMAGAVALLVTKLKRG